MPDLELALTLAVDWGHLGKVALMLLFIFACVLLILTVLIQRPQGGGLAGAFGSGAGSGQTAFGAKTGDALTVATIIMFVFYLGSAIGLSYAVRPGAPGSATPTVVPAKPGDAAKGGEAAKAGEKSGEKAGEAASGGAQPVGVEPVGTAEPVPEPTPQPAPASPEPGSVPPASTPK